MVYTLVEVMNGIAGPAGMIAAPMITFAWGRLAVFKVKSSRGPSDGRTRIDWRFSSLWGKEGGGRVWREFSPDRQ